MRRANEVRSTRFYTAGGIDADAWFRIAAADYEALIAGCDFAAALADVGTLFDAGCGLGRFPALLAPRLGALRHAIEVDYLDASAHCVARLADALKPPFWPGKGTVAAIEDFVPPGGGSYDLVWAIQSLYAWDRERLAHSLAKLRALAGEGGELLIYLAAAPAFYHRFHDAYRAAFAPRVPAYITAEEALDALPGPAFAKKVFRVEHAVPAGDRRLLEIYLRQLVFDTGRTLADFERAGTTGSLLAESLAGAEYRFAQEVWLIGTRAIIGRL